MSKDLMIIGTIMLLGSMQSVQADERGIHKDLPSNHAKMQGENRGWHPSQESVQSRGEMKGTFVKKKTVNGYQLTFHVMKAADDLGHGGAYQFKLKVEQNGRPVKNLIVNSKVTHPKNQSESKMMLKMGDWYTAGYDLTHPGNHELIVLFKAKDGSKHSAGVYYPVEMQE